MNVIRVFVTAIFGFSLFDYGHSIIPLIPAAAAGVGAVVTVIGWGYTTTACRFTECCTDEYITSNFSCTNCSSFRGSLPKGYKLQKTKGRSLYPFCTDFFNFIKYPHLILALRSTLETELYGQELAIETVLSALQNHVDAKKNKKALVMSLHGSSGTGKTHLVNFVIDALYKNGRGSKYVHTFNGYLVFSAKEGIEQYQAQIKQDITRHLKSCPRSIFIFNEVDHIPEGILDGLLLFLDYNPRVLDVDPTQAIFILVSNTGAAEIEKLSTQMWQDGKKREEVKLLDFESVLVDTAFHEQSGFRNSDIIHMNFIDRYIPFLPLERIHVKKCIDAAFKRRKLSDPTPEMIEEVLTHLTFEPPPHNLYSKSGCKRVDPKVSAMIDINRHTNPAGKEHNRR